MLTRQFNRASLWVLVLALTAITAARGATFPNRISGEERGWPPHQLRGRDISTLVTSVESRDYNLGPFQLRWHADQGGWIDVTHSAEPEHSLFSTLAGRPFVYAGTGIDRVTEYRGSFVIGDQRGKMVCYRQTITAIDQYSPDGVLMSGRLTGENCDVAYRVKFETAAPGRLRFHIETFADNGAKSPINRTFLRYRSQASERFFGFGEQFTYMDVKGRAVPVFVREQGHLRGGYQPFSRVLNMISSGAAGAWHTSYVSMPYYITSERRGLFLENYEYSLFDMTLPDEVMVRVWSPVMDGQILYGQDYMGLISAFSQYTGRMKALPDWFHSGAIVGVMGGSSFARSIHARLKRYNTPVAAYWLQDWQGQRKTPLATRMWWNWEVDETVYPDWRALVEEFKSDGVRVLGYINPFLSDVTGNPHARRNMYEEARQAGLLIMGSNKRPVMIDSGGLAGAMVDFSNPKARSWYKTIIKEQLIGGGMSGWMADFGETMPLSSKLFNGNPNHFHNQYVEEWARVNREAVDEAGLNGDTVFFMRSGYTRSPSYVTLFWEGDQMVTWDEHDGLKSAIAGLLSGGISGMSLNHSDIGGVIAMKGLGGMVNFSRTRELLVRWAEMNAFTSVYRNHEGNQPENCYQFYSDEETLYHFSYFAKIYAALMPYRRQLFKEAEELGHPVVRHPFLEYGSDPVTFSLKEQFMLGHDFLVAPVTEPGRTTQRLYLPRQTRWVHLWSGKTYEGGTWVEPAAPWGQPPVFYRLDSPFGAQLAAVVQTLKPPLAMNRN